MYCRVASVDAVRSNFQGRVKSQAAQEDILSNTCQLHPSDCTAKRKEGIEKSGSGLGIDLKETNRQTEVNRGFFIARLPFAQTIYVCNNMYTCILVQLRASVYHAVCQLTSIFVFLLSLWRKKNPK